MLDAYKKEKGSWAEYEKAFIGLMEARRIENEIDPEVLSGSCLLCSEDKPHQCHRRLVLEYLANCWGGMQIEHLA
jgi:hypothetical protein